MKNWCQESEKQWCQRKVNLGRIRGKKCAMLVSQRPNWWCERTLYNIGVKGKTSALEETVQMVSDESV